MKTQVIKTKVELLDEILNTNGYLAEASGTAQAWTDILKIEAKYANEKEKEQLLRLASKFDEINTNIMKSMEVIRTNSIKVIYRNYKK
jgi:hypothetical protein